MIVRTPGRDRFVVVDKTSVEDKRLSWKARGIHHYLLGKPDNWQVMVAELVKASDRTGRTAVTTALKELEEHGYIVRTRGRTNGRFDSSETVVYESPQVTADAGNPDMESPGTADPEAVTPDSETPGEDDQGTAEPAAGKSATNKKPIPPSTDVNNPHTPTPDGVGASVDNRALDQRPPNSRAHETNPRKQGTNPRAQQAQVKADEQRERDIIAFGRHWSKVEALDDDEPMVRSLATEAFPASERDRELAIGIWRGLVAKRSADSAGEAR